jgi:hypothetical protein
MPEALLDGVKHKRAIVFLEVNPHREGRTGPPLAFGLPSEWNYLLLAMPFIADGGVILPSSPSDEQLCLSHIARTLQEVSTEALSKHADLIVIGRAAESEGIPCTLEGGPGLCARFQVSRTIAGNAPAGNIPIHVVVPGWAPRMRTEALVFLQATRTGTFEVLVNGAAAKDIQSDGTVFDGQRVDAIAQDIQNLRRGNTLSRQR